MNPKSLQVFGLCLMTVSLACAPRAGRRGRAGSPADAVHQASPSALFQQGVAKARAGDFIRSEQYLAFALQQGYPEDEVLPLLLRVCVASSRLRLAVSYGEPYLQRHPDQWPLRFLLASVFHGLGEEERALQELERVIQSAADQPEPYFVRGMILLDDIARRDEAVEHLERYLELDPEGSHAAQVREALREMPPLAPGPPPEAPPASAVPVGGTS